MTQNENIIPLTENESLTLEAVGEIQSIKRDNGQQPDFATLPEVYNFLRPELPAGFEPAILNALRSLYRRQLIVYRMNISKIPMFGIKE